MSFSALARAASIIDVSDLFSVKAFRRSLKRALPRGNAADKGIGEATADPTAAQPSSIAA